MQNNNFILLDYMMISETIAQAAALNIIDKFWQVANFRAFMKAHFNNFCYERSIKFSANALDLQYKKHENSEPIVQQQQPNPLYHDNFFPAAAGIDQPTPKNSLHSSKIDSKEKKSIRQITQQSISQLSKSSKKGINSHNKLANRFVELDLPPAEEEQAITKSLRKQHEQHLQKEREENEKRKKETPKKKGKGD